MELGKVQLEEYYQNDCHIILLIMRICIFLKLLMYIEYIFSNPRSKEEVIRILDEKIGKDNHFVFAAVMLCIVNYSVQIFIHTLLVRIVVYIFFCLADIEKLTTIMHQF